MVPMMMLLLLLLLLLQMMMMMMQYYKGGGLLASASEDTLLGPKQELAFMCVRLAERCTDIGFKCQKGSLCQRCGKANERSVVAMVVVQAVVYSSKTTATVMLMVK
uniref:Secreted protein n=1 Tax=Anopheles maculatus TaxID=74869 RepID=A0A182T2Y7_9DIPT